MHHILIVLELNIFQKKLKSKNIKTNIEYKHSTQKYVDTLALDLLILFQKTKVSLIMSTCF